MHVGTEAVSNLLEPLATSLPPVTQGLFLLRICIRRGLTLISSMVVCLGTAYSIQGSSKEDVPWIYTR